MTSAEVAINCLDFIYVGVQVPFFSWYCPVRYNARRIRCLRRWGHLALVCRVCLRRSGPWGQTNKQTNQPTNQPTNQQSTITYIWKDLSQQNVSFFKSIISIHFSLEILAWSSNSFLPNQVVVAIHVAFHLTFPQKHWRTSFKRRGQQGTGNREEGKERV